MKEPAITDPFYLQIQQEINRLDRKVSFYNFAFYSVRVILIGLAGAITIITAAKTAQKGSANYEIIVWLGALTTMLTAADTLFQTDTKLNTYKLMLYDFRTLRTEFVHRFYQKDLSKEWKEEGYKKYYSIKSLGRDLIGSESK